MALGAIMDALGACPIPREGSYQLNNRINSWFIVQCHFIYQGLNQKIRVLMTHLGRRWARWSNLFLSVKDLSTMEAP